MNTTCKAAIYVVAEFYELFSFDEITNKVRVYSPEWVALHVIQACRTRAACRGWFMRRKAYHHYHLERLQPGKISLERKEILRASQCEKWNVKRHLRRRFHFLDGPLSSWQTRLMARVMKFKWVLLIFLTRSSAQFSSHCQICRDTHVVCAMKTSCRHPPPRVMAQSPLSVSARRLGDRDRLRCPSPRRWSWGGCSWGRGRAWSSSCRAAGSLSASRPACTGYFPSGHLSALKQEHNLLTRLWRDAPTAAKNDGNYFYKLTGNIYRCLARLASGHWDGGWCVIRWHSQHSSPQGIREPESSHPGDLLDDAYRAVLAAVRTFSSRNFSTAHFELTPSGAPQAWTVSAWLPVCDPMPVMNSHVTN